MLHGPAHADGEFVDEGRLEREQVVLRHADQRRTDGLVSSTFRRERNARGRTDQYETGVLIASVIERVQSPADEGVVERPDGKQACSEHVLGQAEHAEQEEQVVLRDAQLDMLAAGGRLPLLGGGDVLQTELVRARLAIEQAPLIDPAAQVGGDRDVR